MKHVAAATFLLLSACSKEQPAAATNEAAAKPAEQAAAPPSAAATREAGSLHGQVSALTANVSGLERRVTDDAVIIALATDTLFAFDRADLDPEAAANLGRAADEIRAGAPGHIAISGYTDSEGSDSYNRTLSTRRAQAVADWMGRQVGVRLRRFVVSGKGEADPVAPNTRPDGGDSPEGRARNRRVEIAIPRPS